MELRSNYCFRGMEVKILAFVYALPWMHRLKRFCEGLQPLTLNIVCTLPSCNMNYLLSSQLPTVPVFKHATTSIMYLILMYLEKTVASLLYSTSIQLHI